MLPDRAPDAMARERLRAPTHTPQRRIARRCPLLTSGYRYNQSMIKRHRCVIVPPPPSTPAASAASLPHHWSKPGAVIDHGFAGWHIERDADGTARWVLWSDRECTVVVARGREPTAPRAEAAMATALYEHVTKMHKPVKR